MTTNETLFFRDRTPFDLFRDVILPDALARNIVRIGEGIALVRREPRLAVDHATRVLWAVALSSRPRSGRG